MQVVRMSCVGQSAGCSWALVCIKSTGPSFLSLFRCKFSVRGETSRHLISVRPQLVFSDQNVIHVYLLSIAFALVNSEERN